MDDFRISDSAEWVADIVEVVSRAIETKVAVRARTVTPLVTAKMREAIGETV